MDISIKFVGKLYDHKTQKITTDIQGHLACLKLKTFIDTGKNVITPREKLFTKSTKIVQLLKA